MNTISLIGLGKLGAPMAACFAARGYHVIGVDTNPQVVVQVNAGQAPVFEPGLQDLLNACKDRIQATTDYRTAVLDSEVTFIVVPTPSEKDGGFSLRYVAPAARSVGEVLRQKDGFHLVVLTSTVMPGSTGGVVRPLLEEASGKRSGVDFGLCYSPEFIALGSVIRDLLNPDFILIGESDSRSGELLASLYHNVCDNNPPIARMNFVNAELTKLAVNTFVTTKITFANMLARMCERLPGTDVDVVTAALGLDSRIGPKYLKGAIGYGGPCFPRDNLALACLGRQLGVPATLAEATDAMNRQQVPYLVNLVRENLPDGGEVAVLGLSYKPNTSVVEESQGLELARSLAATGIPVLIYDPAAMETARPVLDGLVTFASSLDACVREADVIVITTPWPEFRGIQPEHLARRDGRRPVVVDCWRVLERMQFDGVAEYVALGQG